MAKEDSKEESGSSFCFPMTTMMRNVIVLVVFFLILFVMALFMKNFTLVGVLMLQMVVIGLVGYTFFQPV